MGSGGYELRAACRSLYVAPWVIDSGARSNLWRQAGSNRVASRPLGAPLAVRARSGTTVRVLFPAKAELDEPESHVG
jgi:hypothetical protein